MKIQRGIIELCGVCNSNSDKGHTSVCLNEATVKLNFYRLSIQPKTGLKVSLSWVYNSVSNKQILYLLKIKDKK